ncbi:aspartate--tRNA ligase [Thermospira aquatica]|uniref:Aspartate--tRNA(Asp/Asn) ligase n=1 Tax=Thermospira aquatica TaxID=2828656 RepID=A0AAX3BA72_9SPIR|nr:aspartate--tRNA ligase [Thermospira aquatica]URA09117.1 aspartate--tRNA ligase [Thermospira aquatica]
MIRVEQQRTHFCGEICDPSLVSKRVTLTGWVQNYRDHGGLMFIDLRDRSGLVQLVFDPQTNPAAHEIAKKARHEDVLSVSGIVQNRDPENVNPKMKTGAYEVKIDRIDFLNRSKTPPFQIDQEDVSEEIRLKYRYLDIRRPAMYNNLFMRHRITQTVRRFLDEHGFLEVETPILNRSTPEGARDFLVPSRLSHGKFYALPQSPQIFKQLLMVGGLERYYQIARCFRDEDLRADRQPEFTQIDIEMSFVRQEDVMRLMEQMIARVLEENYDIKISLPIAQITYQEAMEKYGIDRPDLRFGMELVDVTDVVRDSDFAVFKTVAEKGGMIKCLPVPEGDRLSRKDLDDLIAFVGKYGAKGMAWMRVKDGKLESNIVKYFSDSIQQKLLEVTGARENYTLLFVGDVKKKVVYDSMANLRLHLGDRFGLRKKGELKFVWVVDFPLFEWNEEENRYDAVHHPFTAPKLEDMALLETDPLKVRSDAYDLVLNGIELGGGSIRIHDMELQAKIFELLKISREEAREKFGFLLEALEFGAPPHGGLAFGLDRMVMEFQGLSNIRDVIAFPKTQKGTDMMCDSPSEVTPKQLEELGIKVVEYRANK